MITVENGSFLAYFSTVADIGSRCSISSTGRVFKLGISPSSGGDGLALGDSTRAPSFDECCVEAGLGRPSN